MRALADLHPQTYRPHPLHDPKADRPWGETNCYTDVVLELLHGLGYEPFAALPFTLTCDFELDQWTFFKFPHADIAELYGLGIHELAPWKPLEVHLVEHTAADRPVLVEMDSYFLPDTQGAAYRIAHVKSTVAVSAIDPLARTMVYFHNQGLHRLSGDDYRDVLQADGLCHPRMMPPYIEFVKPVPAWEAGDLAERSLAILRRRSLEMPSRNPFLAFRPHFEADLDGLIAGSPDAVHAYSFATFRQFGSCFWLASEYVAWLSEQGVGGLDEVQAAAGRISTAAKGMQFGLARAIARKRRMETTAILGMADDWEVIRAGIASV